MIIFEKIRTYNLRYVSTFPKDTLDVIFYYIKEPFCKYLSNEPLETIFFLFKLKVALGQKILQRNYHRHGTSLEKYGRNRNHRNKLDFKFNKRKGATSHTEFNESKKGRLFILKWKKFSSAGSASEEKYL